MQKSRVLLYGEDWKGSHIYEVERLLSLKGFACKKFNFYPFIYRVPPVSFINKAFRLLFTPILEFRLNSSFLRLFEEFRPEILFISKGRNLKSSTLSSISKYGCKIVNWNPDDFFNAQNSSKNILNSLSLYDLVISARKHRMQFYFNSGVKKCEYIDWYYQREIHLRTETLPITKQKICFFGSYSRRRANIIDTIAQKYEIDIYGYGWSKYQFANKGKVNILNKSLGGNEFSSVVQSYLVNLNLLSEANYDKTNQRFFEISAAGGLMLCEKSDVFSSILIDELDCFYFTDESILDTLDKIYTLDINDLIRIRDNGYLKVTQGKNDLNSKVEDLIKYLDLIV